MVIIGDTILQGGATHIPLSGVTAYHLLEGSLALASTTPTSGFSTTLYTGNGSTQSINTGVDMATQWGNDASEKFGGLVWLKSRGTAYNHSLQDTIRGTVNAKIGTNVTDAEGTGGVADGYGRLSAFNNNGFTVENGVQTNTSSATYASWNFQTTHRVSGTTNHGKAYTCHFNPFTGFTIVKYEGSGIAGHEIPHHLGRKLGIYFIKNLSQVSDWWVKYSNENYLYLSKTYAQASDNGAYTGMGNDSVINTYQVNNLYNDINESYILYGWANSYLDKSNKLIGNYEVGVYQGTGASGNKVVTRGKPAWVMRKRLDAISDWVVFDSLRTSSGNFLGRLFANTSQVEATNEDHIDVVSDGFILANHDSNTSGGQYLYMVAYDTNLNGGGSYYPRATDTSNLQIQNAIIPYANGVDVNGTKLSILSKNESISGVTLSQGKNYVYCDNTGAYGKSIHRPRYLASDLVRTYAGEQPDYFDVNTNKWYSCDAGSELVTNGTFDTDTSGWTAVGSTLSVVNGTIKVTTSSGYGLAEQSISTIVGKKYKIRFSLDVKSNTQAGLYIDMYSGVISGNYLYNTGILLAVGVYEAEFIAQNTTTYLKLVSENVAGYYTQWDNISVFEADIEQLTETTSRNYLNHIVHADSTGNPLYIEELPKTEYKDVIKANEYQGKNACTAWVNFDGTTTPPTIRDSYNVSKVIRTATGYYDVYFENAMDNLTFTTAGIGDPGYIIHENVTARASNKIQIRTYSNSGTATNLSNINVQLFGGKN